MTVKVSEGSVKGPKPVLMIGLVVALVGVAAFALGLLFSRNAQPPRDYAMECHTLTAHPADPKRLAAGVADAQIAPGLAIPTCEKALAASPADPMLLFELGRALWVGGRDVEAVVKLAEAAELGHGGAMKLLGDAYLQGRLPEGEEANIHTAAEWYQKSADAGFTEGEAALAEANDQIRRNTFDPTLFQNREFMRVLYEADWASAKEPLSLAYYAQGMVASMDSNEALFMDQPCKAMIGRLGSQLVSASTLAGAIAQLGKSRDGEELAGNVVLGIFQEVTRKYNYDQGYRDATVLYNKDVLGCDSSVTKTVLSNVMLTSNGDNRAF